MFDPLQLLLLLTLSGASATQTDWYGGYGVSGPVADWDDKYDTSTEIAWYRMPGSILLQYDLSVEQVEITTGDYRNLHSFDLENDGDLDILVTQYYPCAIRIYVNQGGGLWTQEFVFSNPGSQARAYIARTGDLDGDGDIDVVANYDPDWYTPCFAIFFSTTEGWEESTICDKSAADLWVVDIDGDEDLDIAGRMKLGYMGWWENQEGLGTSWIQHSISMPGFSIWSTRAADYDLDGDMDLLVLKSYGTHIYLLQQQSDHSFITIGIPDQVIQYPNCAEFCDMDGDEDLDVVGSCWYNDPLFWYEQLTPESWEHHIIEPDTSWDYPFRIGCADLDLDGDVDVYGTMSNSSCIAWFENLDGEATSWLRHDMLWCSYGRGLCSGDFNNDGRPDFAVASSISEDFNIYSLDDVEDAGSLTSSILDTGTYPAWDSLSWSASIPTSTSVSFIVRASNDPSIMGSWSDTLSTPGSLSGYIEQGTRYFQYRAILSTQDSISPSLEEVTVSWTDVGIAVEGPAASSTELLPFYPNPSAIHEARFSISNNDTGFLGIFDISGRLVSEQEGPFNGPGEFSVIIPYLPAGIYICRLSTEKKDIQRYLVQLPSN